MKTIKNYTFIAAITSLGLTAGFIYAAAPLSQEGLNKQLIRAAHKGFAAEDIQLLVSQNADVNALSDKQRSPLLYAIHHGKHETARALLALNANPNMNSTKKTNSTALISAIQSGCAKTVSMLLAHNAHIRPLEPIHESALYFAFRKKSSPEIIELCLKNLLNTDEAAIAFDRLFQDKQAIAELDNPQNTPRNVRWRLANSVKPMVLNDCNPNSYAAAMSIHMCIENHQCPVSDAFYDYHAAHYRPSIDFLNQKSPRRIEEKGTHPSNVMQLAQEYTSPDGTSLPFCALICGSSEQMFTTDQDAEHLALGIPDYSGTRTQNKSLLAKIEEVNAKGYGSIPILCIIRFTNPPGYPPVPASARHCVLITLVKERGQDPYLLYYDTNAQTPDKQPDVLRWLRFIDRYYAGRLHSNKNAKRKHDASCDESAQESAQAASKKAQNSE